ncbi:hypothetical protein [Pseudarthrobacter sp. BRE9]|uniref:hypothetical protein n=1 Tax=Pseudarthrobacter sp. BRE9 TaxID=2962582 RepID=UPI002880FBD7|nr:hypothetical protein [Pseudarthrobacter sp. BRE9]MDT0171014.1 hypothetical protein [Pseudarthrobacter sp. BRE9]
MITIDWAVVGPYVILPVASVMTAFLVAKIQHKGKPENALIDQMQQELASLRARMNGFEARDLVYIPHILRLNMHIEQGLGPPAPKIPKVIQSYLDQKDEEDAS